MNRVAMAGLLSVPEPVKTADTNTNQVVTAQEWAAVTDRWYNLLDKDRVGYLALETLPKTQIQQMMANAPRERRR